MKTREYLTGGIRLSLEEIKKSCDFPLDQLGEVHPQYCLVCIDVADELLPFSVLFARSKSKQVGSAKGVEHAVEGSSLEPTPSPIDGPQSREAVE